jgi:hypothetical protein
LSLDFILVAAGGRGECWERQVAWCQARGNMLATVLILVAAGVGARILIFFGFNPKTIPELGNCDLVIVK